MNLSLTDDLAKVDQHEKLPADPRDRFHEAVALPQEHLRRRLQLRRSNPHHLARAVDEEPDGPRAVGDRYDARIERRFDGRQAETNSDVDDWDHPPPNEHEPAHVCLRAGD